MKKMWYGISENGKYHKVTPDLDCLQPDAERVHEVNWKGLDDSMLYAIKKLEGQGAHVFIEDEDKTIYETEDGNSEVE